MNYDTTFPSRPGVRRPALLILQAALFITLTCSAVGASASKIAADLGRELSGSGTSQTRSWSRDIDGVRHVKVLIVARDNFGDLAALRADVLRRGGSVYVRHIAVSALSAMLPAHQVAAIAARADVQSVSPNRLTARTGVTMTPSAIEAATGVVGDVRRRTEANSRLYTGLDGAGIGIAVLDSGVMWKHQLFSDWQGQTRVKRAIDFLKVGDAQALGVRDWTPGRDVSESLQPGSAARLHYERSLDNTNALYVDAFVHGTHVAAVAAVAAGRDFKQTLDTTGIAPGANIFDLKVLDGNGVGQLSDVLAAIDWVLFHAKAHNIRVMNLSLAADSTESWVDDPLARAVRSATAAGITVVVAAGNFGQTDDGRERLGSISSPGHDPTVITVGSANTRGTAGRGDDSVNFFSSRGPTRGARVDASGRRLVDNLLKPDLVAPGNKILGALATDSDSMKQYSLLPHKNKELTQVPGANQQPGVSVMMLSGTSVAAPVVAGTLALMLQANPGLTPPLIKAILQYSAQPLPGANLLQQGAGLLNVEGAVRLARSLRTDIASAVAAGLLQPGSPLLAAGRTMPQARSTLSGQTFDWSRVVTVGGNQIVSGDALFTSYQAVWDPQLVWAGPTVRRQSLHYWPAAAGVDANTHVRSVSSQPAPAQTLIGAGVVNATLLAGMPSQNGQTGPFIPTQTLSRWLASGSGFLLSEGFILSEGFLLSESGQPGSAKTDDLSLLGEP